MGLGPDISNWMSKHKMLIISIIIIALIVIILYVKWTETVALLGAFVNEITNTKSESLIYATSVGIFGSTSYFSALYFGFMKNDEVFRKICPSGDSQCQKICKVVWFIFIGGIIAMIFQIPQKDQFVPIQAFVLGTTWPSVVSQILTGAQGDRSAREAIRSISTSDTTDGLVK